MPVLTWTHITTLSAAVFCPAVSHDASRDISKVILEISLSEFLDGGGGTQAMRLDHLDYMSETNPSCQAPIKSVFSYFCFLLVVTKPEVTAADWP